MALEQGTLLGRYRVGDKLGAGAFGDVYRAYDPKLQRWVAIKLLTRDRSEKVRLVAEARAVAALNHPNVISVYEIEEVSDTAFMVMELAEGESLRVRADGAPTSKKLLWLDQIASALAAAHRAGFIHRDIKPSNILIVDGTGWVKVLDFGIAKRVGPLPSRLDGTQLQAPMTAAGQVVGTLSYLSPEQLHGVRPGPSVDQWAWGVLAFELLAGIHPARAAGVPVIADWIVSGPTRPLGPLAPDAPAGFVAAVMRALSRDVGARFPSMDALHAEISRHVGSVGGAAAETKYETVRDRTSASPVTVSESNDLATFGSRPSLPRADTTVGSVVGSDVVRVPPRPVAFEPTRISNVAVGSEPALPPTSDRVERLSLGSVPLVRSASPPASGDVRLAPAGPPAHMEPRTASSGVAPDVIDALDRSATQVLVLGLLGTVTACGPLGFVGLLSGLKLQKRARTAGVSTPPMAVVGTVLSILSCVVFLGVSAASCLFFLTPSSTSEPSNAARIAALEKSVAKKKSGATLPLATACDLTELYLRRDLALGEKESSFKVECKGVVQTGTTGARLEGLVIDGKTGPETFDVCFSHGAEWSVTEVRAGCSLKVEDAAVAPSPEPVLGGQDGGFLRRRVDAGIFGAPLR